MLRNAKNRALIACIALPLSAACVAAAAALPARADLPEAVLHTFTGSNTNGRYPYAALTQAPDGSFYGTTWYGGAEDTGTVFQLKPNGSYQLLHSFGDGTVKSDGQYPFSTLTIGSDGLLYGTTYDGGASGLGTVYSMTPSGTVKILHSFSGGTDGAYPAAAVTLGNDGKLYGLSTGDNGTSSACFGTVYSMNLDGSDYLVQYRFGSANSPTVGEQPESNLATAGSTSNVLYGTAYYGGVGGNGTVFSIAPGTTDGSGTLTVLHSFGDGTVANDGAYPDKGRLQLNGGCLYGVTTVGGAYGDGIVFKLALNGAETVLHSFAGASDGTYPDGGIMMASDGNYYGTTSDGGLYGNGTVYSFSTAGAFNTIYNFGDNGSADGADAFSKPLEDSDGDLIGTTTNGGASYYGIVYRLIAGLPNPVKLSTLAVSAPSIGGGTGSVSGTVTLNKPAPSAGAQVSLVSSNLSAATVPATVTVPGNAISAAFSIKTYEVTSPSNVTFTASYNNTTASGSLDVVPPTITLVSVLLTPNPEVSGSTATGNRAYLNGNALRDTTVTLTSSNPAIASVPARMLIKAGSSSHLFTIKAAKVTANHTVIITATANGVSQSAKLTVTP